MSSRARKYVLYAIGEVALIIIGIMIALQIDNWNTDRQQRELLDSYLQSIALDMQQDAKELEQLGAVRRGRTVDSIRMFMLLGRRNYTYDIPEIFFFNRVTNEATENIYFRPDSAGYEALRSSNVMSLMQGEYIERVLSMYYEQVELIADLEQLHNEMINELNMQFIMSFPDELPQWMFVSPRALPAEDFDAMQPYFDQIINGSSARHLVSRQMNGSFLNLEYDRLKRLGTTFIEIVESGDHSTAEPENKLVNLGDFGGAAGNHSELINGGELATHIYNISAVADRFETIFDFRFIEPTEDALRITYPGSDSWAAVFLQVWGLEDDRPSLDYSQFNKLVLELKGDASTAVLNVQIKDAFLPDTMPPDSVSLAITSEWATYEVDLGRFPNTDLTSLITPLGFSFAGEPQSFYIRNARYETTE